ncbi:hypothetical protein RFH42_08200 [Acinetobacter rudis]|uniref:hypothetical protein n=1 Tax=Acinetobacter rudis TaxID=632955 RepID=UPI00280E76AD|nr:hypothetical protein [Acinetobacter rudis]MDQ8952945.1 hypothetical protein [Acinetobacter rudis]
MLEFWFDSTISTTKKLMLFILIAMLTIALYLYQALDPISILMFMGAGVIFLICRYLKQHFAQNHPTGLLYRFLTWIPVACILALVLKNIQTGEILLPGAQGIGFMTLAVCIFSPMSLFNQNRTTP